MLICKLSLFTKPPDSALNLVLVLKLYCSYIKVLKGKEKERDMLLINIEHSHVKFLEVQHPKVNVTTSFS